MKARHNQANPFLYSAGESTHTFGRFVDVVDTDEVFEVYEGGRVEAQPLSRFTRGRVSR